MREKKGKTVERIKRKKKEMKNRKKFFASLMNRNSFFSFLHYEGLITFIIFRIFFCLEESERNFVIMINYLGCYRKPIVGAGAKQVAL